MIETRRLEKGKVHCAVMRYFEFLVVSPKGPKMRESQEVFRRTPCEESGMHETKTCCDRARRSARRLVHYSQRVNFTFLSALDDKKGGRAIKGGGLRA